MEEPRTEVVGRGTQAETWVGVPRATCKPKPNDSRAIDALDAAREATNVIVVVAPAATRVRKTLARAIRSLVSLTDVTKTTAGAKSALKKPVLTRLAATLARLEAKGSAADGRTQERVQLAGSEALVCPNWSTWIRAACNFQPNCLGESNLTSLDGAASQDDVAPAHVWREQFLYRGFEASGLSSPADFKQSPCSFY